MSRMTRFLKQKCSLEKVSRNFNNEVTQDDYGNFTYDFPVEVKCRREKYTKTFYGANGSFVHSVMRYFLDDTYPIDINDKLDGHLILSVSDFTNSKGQNEGFEAYV